MYSVARRWWTRRRARPRVAHVAAFNRNVGDNALNHAIERMLGKSFDIEQVELVANPFDAKMIRHLDGFDAVIFGGGGVIHSCSSNSSRKNRERTGTMWNMELGDLREMQTPMVLYGVGYNRFEGEPPPLPAMVEFFDVLRDRGDLIAFRNDGSVARLGDDLPALAGRFAEVPDPGLFCRGERLGRKRPFAIVQLATDRPDFRYPDGLESALGLARTMIDAVDIDAILLPHTASDAKVYERLREQLGPMEIAPLEIGFDKSIDMMSLYRSAEFTISTRGHSQICSIGNGTPTFALSTHPKVAGFMRSLGLEDDCVDLRLQSDADGLAAFERFSGALEERRATIGALNERFDTRIAEFNDRVVSFVEDGAIS